MKERHHGLDTLRGVAVLLMLMFHFTYDLWLFDYVGDRYREGFWFALPRFIVFVFLWCVGAALELVHGQGVRYTLFWRRTLKLVLLAAVISAVTYYTFPQTWIYFGTIHCIAAVSLLALPFFYFRWARLPVFLAILLAQYVFGYDIAWVGQVFPRQTMDFIPAYPWFWVVLLGLMSGPWLLARWRPPANPPLEWLGRHALKIYLLHQALFYALFTLIQHWRKA